MVNFDSKYKCFKTATIFHENTGQNIENTKIYSVRSISFLLLLSYLINYYKNQLFSINILLFY